VLSTDNPATPANIYSDAPRSPGFTRSMKPSVCLFIIFMAGCTGLQQTRPTAGKPGSSSKAESLYLGTSDPGLIRFQIAPDGSLTSASIGAAPQVCYPALYPFHNSIYALSQPCPFNPSATELRRFDLDDNGDIVTSTQSLPFSQNLQYTTSLISEPAGNFLYAQTFGPDQREHISPVQVGPNGELTLKPDLGISFPVQDTSVTECSENHSPIAVLHPKSASLLVIRDSIACNRGASAGFPIFAVDSKTGTIGSSIGQVSIDDASEGYFTAIVDDLVLRGEFQLTNTGDAGNLQLLQVSAATVIPVDVCGSDHPACSHPDAGTLHPSRRWAFIADFKAGGIWALPITANTIAAENASFTGVSTFLSGDSNGGVQFAFSADGMHLYVAHWYVFCPSCGLNVHKPGEILGFNIDQQSGALIPVPGSPWPVESVNPVASFIDVAGKSP
jgi:hypothetical protein